MIANRKGRADWHQATHKTSKCTCDLTDLVAHAKGFIVTLALWGSLTVDLDWLIHWGETHDG